MVGQSSATAAEAPLTAPDPAGLASAAEEASGAERAHTGDASSATGSPSARPPMRLLLVLGALSAFAPLSIDMYLPGLPRITSDFSASTASVQLTLTACLAGLALGQVVAGPLSDAYGRRRPLLVGLTAYVLASILCALAPSLPLLIGARLAQGLAGSVGIVIARAVVRDLASGAQAAKLFAVLLLISGSAPVLAPVLGGQVLHLIGWRGVFVVLTLVGAALLIAAALLVPETVPLERRRTGGLADTRQVFAGLVRDRSYLRYAIASGFAFAAMFTYIASSSFVLEDGYGLSEKQFSAVFAVNALGLVLAGATSGRLVGRVGPGPLLRAGLALTATGGALLLVGALAGGSLGVWAVLPPLFLVVTSQGLVLPNATALALADHAGAAGSAASLLGLLQYVFGAAAAPLAGLSASTSAVPMAVTVAALAAAAVLVYVLVPTKESACV